MGQARIMMFEIAVTSLEPGEGKSIVADALALLLKERGISVLLIREARETSYLILEGKSESYSLPYGLSIKLLRGTKLALAKYEITDEISEEDAISGVRTFAKNYVLKVGLEAIVSDLPYSVFAVSNVVRGADRIVLIFTPLSEKLLPEVLRELKLEDWDLVLIKNMVLDSSKVQSEVSVIPFIEALVHLQEVRRWDELPEAFRTSLSGALDRIIKEISLVKEMGL